MQTIREDITSQIVAEIERGTPPWRKGWSCPDLHKNGLTQASYRGVNQVILAMTPYADSRWFTWKQAEALGVKVKKGCKGHRIVKMVEVDRNRAASVQDGEVLAEDKGKALIMKGYVVFNAEQIEGLPGLPRPATNMVEPVAAVDALIEGMKGTGLTVLYGGGQPAYAPLTDTVKMPLPDRFHTTQDYAATMLHELAHASGNKKRLDRLHLYARFGSEEYSREELVAELSSAFLGAQLGMLMAASMMESHASYMASWLTVLKRDKNEIFRAAAAAQKVADYLGQWAIKPSLEVAPDASQARPSEGQRHEADARAPMKLGR